MKIIITTGLLLLGATLFAKSACTQDDVKFAKDNFTSQKKKFEVGLTTEGYLVWFEFFYLETQHCAGDIKLEDFCKQGGDKLDTIEKSKKTNLNRAATYDNDLAFLETRLRFRKICAEK